jgi:hypothetical protein
MSAAKAGAAMAASAAAPSKIFLIMLPHYERCRHQSKQRDFI